MSIVADVLVIAAGTLVVVLRDRRTLTTALGVIPLVIAMFYLELGNHADALRSLLATVLSGESAVAILGISALTRSVEGGEDDGRWRRSDVLRFDDASPIALLSALLAGVVAFQLASEFPLGGMPAAFASYWLIGIGAFTILQATDLFKLGVGFLVLVNGVQLGILILGLADLRTLIAAGVFAIVASFAMARLVDATDTVRGDVS